MGYGYALYVWTVAAAQTAACIASSFVLNDSQAYYKPLTLLQGLVVVAYNSITRLLPHASGACM